jgi:anti-sigma-K factor RskA
MSEPQDPRHEAPHGQDPGGDEAQTPHDALAAYALAALSVDEQELFEQHLADCTACQVELAALQRTAELLPYGLAPESPPAGARERLLARARDVVGEAPTVYVPRSWVGAQTVSQVPPAEAPTVAPVPLVERDAGARLPAPPVGRAQPRRRGRFRLAVIGWAAAMLVTLAAGLLAGAWSVTGPHASPDMEVLARLPGGRVLALRGTGVPSASARLFVVESGRRAELAVDALPPLPPGRVYQLWFAEPGQTPRTGGAFTVGPSGDAVVQVTIPTPLERVQAVAVTQEPAPGLVSPTGAHLLDWTP